MALKMSECTGNFQVVNFMQIPLQPVFREHKAQRMLTKEVTKQLPSDLLKMPLRKTTGSKSFFVIEEWIFVTRRK